MAAALVLDTDMPITTKAVDLRGSSPERLPPDWPSCSTTWPFANIASARIGAIGCGAFTVRRAQADATTLNAVAMPAARQARPFTQRTYRDGMRMTGR